MDFSCDQYNIDVAYTVTELETGQNVYYNAHASSGWRYGTLAWGGEFSDNRSAEHQYYSDKLNTGRTCGLSLQSGGMAYARNAIPFRVSVNLLKIKSPSIGLGTVTWSPDQLAMDAGGDNGVWCDEDLSQYTGQYPGDPNNDPYSGNGSGPAVDNGIAGGQQGGGVSPKPTNGTWYCSYWTDWWVSWNGGRTWQYDGRDCYEWGQYVI
jgi:hypothetical protein